MATDDHLAVGSTGEFLETVKTAAGDHREGVFIGSPTVDAARVAVLQTPPNGSSDYGLAAYVLGNVTILNASLEVTGPLTDTQLRATPVPVSGTVTANQGGAPWSVSQSGTWNVGTVTTVTTVTTVSTVTNLSQLGGQAIAMGTGTRSAGTQRVTIATDDLVPVSVSQPSSASVTSVADTASSTTLLSSNSSRRGASIFNDSTEILYVKFGTTASATDFTVKMAAGAYYEVPFGYTGRIDGIWANNASGSARMTEIS